MNEDHVIGLFVWALFFAIGNGCLWLVGWFIAWDWDPSHWWVIGRIVASVIAAFWVILITYGVVKVEEERS